MIGAIAGDIIGSVYEWDNIKTTDFPLFSSRCFFTDDTVLTVALAESIMTGIDYADLMKKYYRRYPDAGYGGSFHKWARSSDSAPYNSWGNGAAMRISPVGFAFDSLEDVLAQAVAYTALTHNHTEGIKGAQATAAAIFLARTGTDKSGIRSYIVNSFGYDLNRTCDEIRPVYQFNESCQKTVPEAIIAFLESNSFEHAIRLAISLGGDSDTLACITGGIAEAFYGVPEHIESTVLEILDDELRSLTMEFCGRLEPFQRNSPSGLSQNRFSMTLSRSNFSPKNMKGIRMSGQSTMQRQMKPQTCGHQDTPLLGLPGDISNTPNSCQRPSLGQDESSNETHSGIFAVVDRPNPKMSDADIIFLMRTGLVRVTPERLKRSLLSSLNRMAFPAGHRIISQGKEGDRLFILQHGSCEVNLEKNRELHVVGHLKPGDVFGELAIITGDCRSANVDTLTDVVVWSLDKDRFEQFVESCKELTEFLTDLATERLCSRKITAEKNIGRYRITDVLAEGGWSIVYKGFHSLLNLPVAVKMLKHSMALDSDFFETFQKEAKTIAALNHDNIVRVYDIEQSYRTVFIIMEYLSGTTLRDVIDSGHRLPLKRITRLLTQVCKGLQYAHHQGVVHQDVKPGNIFIQEGDKAKIVDFGLATPIGGCSDDMPGSPHYMAPEQIEGDPVDARTDIYSLGITAYEMATGVRPYPDDICQVLEYHMTKITPDPRELNPELPERFSSFIRKSTEKNPDFRFQDITEVLRELDLMTGEESALTDSGLHPGRKSKSLHICYNSEDEPGVQLLLKEFCKKLKSKGVEVKLS